MRANGVSPRAGLALSLWILVAAGIRFTQLDVAPPWSDEMDTIVFSVGNTFGDIPFDRWLGGEELLRPLAGSGEAGLGRIAHNLLTENIHPPAFFWMTHLWLEAFPPADHFEVVPRARMLSALVGVLAVPGLFLLVRRSMAGVAAAHAAAVIVALSPLAIDVSRQARHYSLALLVVVVALILFARVTHGLSLSGKVPGRVLAAWLLVNVVGVFTHYLVVIAIGAQILTLVALGIRGRIPLVGSRKLVAGVSVVLLVAATVGVALGWDDLSANIPLWLDTGRVAPHENLMRATWWNMIVFVLLPHALLSAPAGVFVPLALTLIAVAGIVTVAVVRGNRARSSRSATDAVSIETLTWYVVFANLLLVAVSVGWGRDLTLGSRYWFVAVPGLIALVAGGLTAHLEAKRGGPGVLTVVTWPTRAAPVLVAVIMTAGAVTVIAWPGCLVNMSVEGTLEIVERESARSAAIATDAGRLLALGWEVERSARGESRPFAASMLYRRIPSFRDRATAEEVLAAVAAGSATLPRPRDLWLISLVADDVDPAVPGRVDARSWDELSAMTLRHYALD